jgi:hypothetical protein
VSLRNEVVIFPSVSEIEEDKNVWERQWINLLSESIYGICHNMHKILENEPRTEIPHSNSRRDV